MPRVPYRIADQAFVIGQIGQLYDHPHNAFKEYPVNSVDAYQEAELIRGEMLDPLTIAILVNRQNRQVQIQDNGPGMSYDFLRSIPQSIGESTKRGVEQLRGEKAFGMLAFHNFARQCLIYSRDGGTGNFYYLRMSGDEEEAEVDFIDPGRIAFGAFERGTRVIFDRIEVPILERYFTPAKLREAMSEIFSPLLRKRVVSIRIGYLGKGQRLSEIEPIEHKGELILEKVIEVDYIRDREEKKGEIDVRLHVNPKGTNEKVRTYNKGVRVLTTLTGLDELKHYPWDSGKVSGEIDENFLPVRPARDGYVRGRRFEIFVEGNIGLEGKVSQELERLKEESRRHEMEDFANSWLEALAAMHAMVRRSYEVLIKGREGDEIKKTKVKTKGGARGTLGGKRNGPPKRRGRDEVEETPEGTSRPTRRGRRYSSAYIPSFERFDLAEMRLRSKLGEVGNVIRINIEHEEFLRLDESRNERAKQRYVGLLLSKEIAFAEFKRAIEEFNLPPVEQAHLMSEVTAQFYQTGLEALQI